MIKFSGVFRTKNLNDGSIWKVIVKKKNKKKEEIRLRLYLMNFEGLSDQSNTMSFIE
jgi:hypothetical protein